MTHRSISYSLEASDAATLAIAARRNGRSTADEVRAAVGAALGSPRALFFDLEVPHRGIAHEADPAGRPN